jgi:hypothetical protein
MVLLIIILAIALALGGLMGGMWLWQKMAESPIWEQMRKYVKIVGLGGASGLFAIVIFLVWKMVTQPPEYFRQCISCINIGPWFLFFYMLGCDASILCPEPEEMKAPHGNEKSTLKFHLKWDLLKKELLASIIAIAPAVALLLFSKIGIQVFEMWVAGVVGFAMGFFFWEHLKETGILTGPFKRQLAILCLLTTVVIGCIAGYGVYVDFSAGNPESIRTLLVSIMLFIECMAWYMLALCVVVFRAK